MPYLGNVFSGVQGCAKLVNPQRGQENLPGTDGSTVFEMRVNEEMARKIQDAQNRNKVTRLLQVEQIPGKNSYRTRIQWPETIDVDPLSVDVVPGTVSAKVRVDFRKNYNLFMRGLAKIYMSNNTKKASEIKSEYQRTFTNIRNYCNHRCSKSGDANREFDTICSDLNISTANKDGFKTFMDTCCVHDNMNVLTSNKILPIGRLEQMWKTFAIKLESNEALLAPDVQKKMSESLRSKLIADNISAIEQLKKMSDIPESGMSDTTFTVCDCGANATLISKLSQHIGERGIVEVKRIEFVAEENKELMVKEHFVGVLGELDDGRVLTAEAFAPNKDTLFDSPGTTSKMYFGLYREKDAIEQSYLVSAD